VNWDVPPTRGCEKRWCPGIDRSMFLHAAVDELAFKKCLVLARSAGRIAAAQQTGAGGMST
jgi:hypothetical protein